MGLRTPQELLRNKNSKPAPRANFKPGNGGQISNKFLGVIDKKLAENDRAAAKKAAAFEKSKADFMDATIKNRLDTARVKAESELSDHEGVSALQNVTDIKKDYFDEVKGIIAKTPEKYRGTLRTKTSVLNNTGKFDRFAIGYTSGQSRKVEKETFDARVANDMNDLVENAGDVNYITSDGMSNVAASIRNRAERKYGTDGSKKFDSGLTANELIDIEIKTGTSEAIRKAIKQQVTTGRFDKAQATFEKTFDDLTPEDRVKIVETMKRGQIDQTDSQALALSEDAFQSSGGNLVAAEKYALAHAGTDGKLFQKTMSMIQAKNSIRIKQKKIEEDKIYSDSYNNIVKNGDVSGSGIMRLPPEQRDKLINTLNKNGGGAAVLTNQKEAKKVRDQLDLMSPEELSKINPQSFSSIMSAKDRELVGDRVKHARQRIEKGFEAGQKWNDRLYKSIASEFAPALELFPNTDEFNKFQSGVEQMYADIIKENPKITEGEIRKKLRRQVFDQTQVPELNTHGFANFFLPGFLELEPTETGEIVRGVPEDFGTRNSEVSAEVVRKWNNARRQQGKPPLTEDQVSDIAAWRARKNR